jgi:NTP pyrophosphatase (non-canonical NTP hydrolase)
MNEIAKEWAEKEVKSEAEAFEKAMSRIKQPEITTDELEQAYRQGYMEGYKHRHSDTRIITIAHHYGYNAQREQFEEECAEAILAAQKCKRTSDDLFKYRGNLLNLAEEVADVLIMAEQMRILISQSLIDEFIQKKLERQIRRMNGEQID